MHCASPSYLPRYEVTPGRGVRPMKKSFVLVGGTAFLGVAIAVSPSCIPGLRSRPGRSNSEPEPLRPMVVVPFTVSLMEEHSLPNLVGSVDLGGGGGVVRGCVRTTAGASLSDAVVTLLLSDGERSVFTDARAPSSAPGATRGPASGRSRRGEVVSRNVHDRSVLRHRHCRALRRSGESPPAKAVT